MQLFDFKRETLIFISFAFLTKNNVLHMKTVPNDKSVEDFLNAVEKDKKRADSWKIYKMMKASVGEEGIMWGDSIIGFGSRHLKYDSGRELDWFKIGFSPRKQNISLYIMKGFEEYDALLSKLGKHKTGKSCLYINKLEDVDQTILQEIIQKSVADL